MKKGIASILTVWIMVNASLFSLILLNPEIDVQISAATIIVDDNGTPGVDCNYTQIQWAIDNASAGDTIFVKNGTYYENVIVNKTINLVGEDKNYTIIDGGGNGDVIYVSSNWVNVSGFNITNAGDNGFPIYDSGIELNNVSNCSIIDNHAYDNSNGIYLEDSDRNLITGNYVRSNFFGIYLDYSDNNNISRNNVSSNSIDGIRSRYSNWNSILNNDVSDSFNGIHLLSAIGCNLDSNIMRNVGIIIQGALINYWTSHNINISNAVNGRGVYFLKNQAGGTIQARFGQIILANCNNIKITNHNLSNTTVGILQGFSYGNNITGNTFLHNRLGLRLYSSNDNTIQDNDFMANHISIDITSSNNNKINNNDLQTSSQSGFNVWGAKYNDFAGNIVTFNSRGFDLYYAGENNFKGNELSENTYSFVSFQSNQNNILCNSLSLSTNSGFYLLSSENNNITNNDVINNLNGFNILSSSINNTIFHNNIKDRFIILG